MSSQTASCLFATPEHQVLVGDCDKLIPEDCTFIGHCFLRNNRLHLSTSVPPLIHASHETTSELNRMILDQALYHEQLYARYNSLLSKYEALGKLYLEARCQLDHLSNHPSLARQESLFAEDCFAPPVLPRPQRDSVAPVAAVSQDCRFDADIPTQSAFQKPRFDPASRRAKTRTAYNTTTSRTSYHTVPRSAYPSCSRVAQITPRSPPVNAAVKTVLQSSTSMPQTSASRQASANVPPASATVPPASATVPPASAPSASVPQERHENGKLQQDAACLFQRAYGLNGFPKEDHNAIIKEIQSKYNSSTNAARALLYG
jgi:hypothetical protein